MEDEHEFESILLEAADMRLCARDNLLAGLEKVGGEVKRRERMGGGNDFEGTLRELTKVDEVPAVDRGAKEDDCAVVEPGERFSAPNEGEEGGSVAAGCKGYPAVVLWIGFLVD